MSDEILSVIEAGENVTEYILNDSEPVCTAITRKELHKNKKLGQGKYGKVYAAGGTYVKRLPKGSYIIKEINLSEEKLKITKRSTDYTLRDLARSYARETLTYDEIIDYNGGNPNRKFKAGEYFAIPSFLEDGRKTTRKYFNTKTGKDDTLSKATYQFTETVYAEYLISLTVSQLNKTKKCAHFIDVLSLSVCSEKIAKGYILMEKIDTELSKMVGHISDKDLRSYYFQTLFAIAAYQHYYKIVHYDTHLNNIFLTNVTPKMKWNGESIFDAQYFKYTIDLPDEREGGARRTCSFYLPATQYIIKIGDWGIACKYGKPQILNESVIQDGLSIPLPNTYCPQYDSLYFTISMAGYKQIPKLSFMAQMLSWIFELPLDSDEDTIYNKLPKLYDDIYRPCMPEIYSDLGKRATALNILRRSILMKQYYIPPEGKIINMGEISDL
jgi:serine/threonine protein kinase